MLRPKSMRVNACVEKGEAEHAHVQAPENAFTAASRLLHQPTGSEGGCSDLAVKVHVYSSIQGKICHINSPFLNYRVKINLHAKTM